MKKVFLFVLILVALLVAPLGASEVRFLNHTYPEEVVAYPAQDMFVICDDCARQQLAQYVEKPEPVIPKSAFLVSVKVEPKETQPKEVQSKPVALPVIFFDFNKAQLKPTEAEKLLSVKDFLKDTSVEVHGYTCPIGSSYYNSGLSAKRAQTVADWLVLHGVKVTKIQGHGETDQFGRTKKDYWLNRRVELKTNPTKKGGE